MNARAQCFASRFRSFEYVFWVLWLRFLMDQSVLMIDS